jgi:hypothetical protein
MSLYSATCLIFITLPAQNPSFVHLRLVPLTSPGCLARSERITLSQAPCDCGAQRSEFLNAYSSRMVAPHHHRPAYLRVHVGIGRNLKQTEARRSSVQIDPFILTQTKCPVNGCGADTDGIGWVNVRHRLAWHSPVRILLSDEDEGVAGSSPHAQLLPLRPRIPPCSRVHPKLQSAPAPYGCGHDITAIWWWSWSRE